MPSSDENNRHSRARKHSAEVATDRTCAYNRNAWPVLKFTHLVIGV